MVVLTEPSTRLQNRQQINSDTQNKALHFIGAGLVIVMIVEGLMT